MDIHIDLIKQIHLKKESLSKNKGNDHVNVKDMYSFIKGCCLLTPQSYGPRIEKRIIKDLGIGFRKSKGDGDIEYKNSKIIEVKSSIIGGTNTKMNVVQIRPFEEIDYYICAAFDVRSYSHLDQHIFLLTKKEMKRECDLIKTSSAHGSKKYSKQNKNVELRFDFEISNKDSIFNRWVKKYKIENMDQVANCIAAKLI